VYRYYRQKLKMRSHSYKIVWRPLLRTTVKKESMLQERVPFGGILNWINCVKNVITILDGHAGT